MRWSFSLMKNSISSSPIRSSNISSIRTNLQRSSQVCSVTAASWLSPRRTGTTCAQISRVLPISATFRGTSISNSPQMVTGISLPIQEKSSNKYFLSSDLENIQVKYYETPFISGHMKFRYLHHVLDRTTLSYFEKAVLSLPQLSRFLAFQILISGDKK